MENCEESKTHNEFVDRAKCNKLEDKLINNLSNFYKIVSDSTRLKIIFALDNYELCVCDLCEVMGMSQSAISHQLATLKNFNIVKSRKQGKEVFYSLADYHIKELIESTITHINEKEN